MYVPKHNLMTDRDEMIAFMQDHPFAIVISGSGSRPVATHMPVVVRQRNDDVVCTFHLSRANDHWKELTGGETLVIFSGDHAYIPPSIYTAIDVPTWNYTTVHAYGDSAIVTDAEAVRDRLRTLIEIHDADPGLWERLTPDLVDPLLGGIVMVDMRVRELQGKHKMGQNRSAADQEAVRIHMESLRSRP
ncbi:MAG: hypothetical protein BGO89_11790 [Candidatus Kapaibacterium thiocyanatum]|uniref:Transcriptional regulator n=1 Tax=Candidatus Kapaibacterium thiocyanatum TaxID=1895771 RepID=A0A1M3KXK1_9BACT|nr:MAG: hypothetical protein BGO89_11790 ['Candidatus Kapabacteria' thiocyanatum]